MKRITLTILGLFLTQLILAQSSEEEILKIFDDQFVAYNNQDVDQLVDNVSEDFKWFYITSDTLLLEVEGKENFRKSMEEYYKYLKSPATSTVAEYTIHANKISFKEVVEHKNKAGQIVTSSAMGIYEINENKITRAWYFID